MTILLLCLLTAIAITKILRLQSDNVETANLDVPTLPQFAIGDPVSTSGMLVAENNFPHYTHIITSQDGKSFGLKSSSLNLNNFSGSLEVQGTIGEIVKALPVIEVTHIKDPSHHLVIKNNSYFFTDELLMFDFDQQPAFKVLKSGSNSIEVYFNDTRLTSYERFVCNKVVKAQNCDQMLLDIKYAATESFSSYVGNDYYRNGTGKWIAFNGNIFGYMVDPIDDERLLDLSNVINIVDKPFVIKNKMSQMETACMSGDEKFIEIRLIDFAQLSPTEIGVVLHGPTTSYPNAKCDVVFDLWDSWAMTQSDLTHISEDSE